MDLFMGLTNILIKRGCDEKISFWNDEIATSR